jgi:hypothetical protein
MTNFDQAILQKHPEEVFSTRLPDEVGEMVRRFARGEKRNLSNALEILIIEGLKAKGFEAAK